MTQESTRKAHIEFGTGEDSVIHIINWSDLNSYLDLLKNAGWDMNQITLIRVTDN